MEEELSLSASTLAALAEFRQEQEQREEQFSKLYQQAEKEFDQTDEEVVKEKGMELFQEDWNLSQFWYSDETSRVLAESILEGATPDTYIAVISAPSAYAAILKLPKEKVPTQHIYLLEHDNRFKLLAKDKFYFYDFARPLELPQELKGKFDRLIVDPPFLSDECQTKASLTARWMQKTTADKKPLPENRVIVCTGERMEQIITGKLYPGVKTTDFYPEHRNGLSNEFRCYANFESSHWKFAS